MSKKEENKLFGEFSPITTEQWVEKIKTDLKGADFEKKLVWKTQEGFNVQPFYREEDLKSLDYLDAFPGEFPYVRGTNKKASDWYVRQEITVTDPGEANKKALDVLMKGVNSLGFRLNDGFIVSLQNIEKLCENIHLESVEINFDTQHHHKELIESITKLVQKKNFSPEKVEGSIAFDPLGFYMVEGSSCNSMEKSLEYAAEMIKAVEFLPKFRIITVHAGFFNNAGSSIVQELGFGLAMGNEYLAWLTDLGLTINQAASRVKFCFATGSNYFMEIAKLRAARLLWAKIVEAYKPAGNEVTKMNIHSVTSEWNKTLYDPYVNLLRTQTEAMSATLGGTNSLTVGPFDKIFKNANAFSERIARNQQLLLKEEAHFDKIVDPGAGSYYIENLTDSIAGHAWELFKKVENKKGFLEALREGFIQKEISTLAEKRNTDIAQRKEIFVGTNQYPNPGEQIISNIEVTKPVSQPSGEKEIIPLVQYRGSEAFETLRLATEKSGKRPKVFMFTYGNPAMRSARAQFSGNFFGVAGYEIIENLGFKTIEEGIEKARKSGAEIAVICSSDEEYIKIAPDIYDALNKKAIIVVAGAPAGMDELKQKGIEHFINIRSNVPETLQNFQKLLGIVNK